MNRTDHARVLLVGKEAAALAPRLELSGHRPLDDESGMSGDAIQNDAHRAMAPEAVLLSPGSEGRLEELRRRWGPVPMLLGLHSDSVEGRIHCLASGADDFWLTERPPSDLLTRLRLHLAMARRAAPSPLLQGLRLGDLELDPSRREVRRAGRVLALTAREYQLLLLLLRERNTVVSRERILAEIWGDAGAAGSNVIEVYVRYLRTKLEQQGGKRLIHTVRGQGYCLAERWPLP